MHAHVCLALGTLHIAAVHWAHVGVGLPCVLYVAPWCVPTLLAA